MSFDCTKQLINRPDFLSVRKHALPLIKRLIEIRPKKNLKLDFQFDPHSQTKNQ